MTKPYCNHLKSDCSMPAYVKCERCPELKTCPTEEQIKEEAEYKRLYILAYEQVISETGPIRKQEHADRLHDLIREYREEGR